MAATVAPSPLPTTTEAPPAGDITWLISGVAAELARRLRVSVGFVRVVLMIAAYAWLCQVMAVYAVAALLLPHGKSRRPGWRNLVGLSRVGIVVVGIELLSGPASLSFLSTGVFGQGPAVWIPFGGGMLAGMVALFTSGYAVTAYDEDRCRRIMIGWIPALLLAATIAVGMLVAPSVR